MQIDTAAILASQQQVQRPAAPPAAQDFAPIAFKQAAKAPPVPTPAAPVEPKTAAAKPAGTGPVRPGTHLDIKV